jgi:hypothetical protein
MCSDYPEYPWPYGARALIAEREKVAKVLELTMLMNHGWRYGGNFENIFKVPLSFQEGFVRNDTERITLIDRVRMYHNFNWKRDVCAHAHPQVNSADGGITKSEKHYNKLIDNLIEMQALTEELKPETLALVATCTSAHELHQAMLNARA